MSQCHDDYEVTEFDPVVEPPADLRVDVSSQCHDDYQLSNDDGPNRSDDDDLAVVASQGR
ncbi:MAG: hypothetical protein QOG97_2016 [Acidimicrobiaceae bacterium]|jgi:hypothetical protein|nr:hypothetical protein [Acidimicrobiaceae bacterium]MDQ1398944.1 hypothetical protein [Acidimicrobiaceae bacterium]MDQ1441788.1 hypothetical protein [Acidimicrobiaceae bacterium]